MMMYAGGSRRRYNEPIAGRTRLMKELFLFLQSARDLPNFFTFRPYKYGPHSKEVLQDLEDSVTVGLVQSVSGFGSEVYSLTPDGFRIASKKYESLDPQTRKQLVDTKIRFNTMHLHELLEYVYDKYPFYASESEYEGQLPE